MVRMVLPSVVSQLNSSLRLPLTESLIVSPAVVLVVAEDAIIAVCEQFMTCDLKSEIRLYFPIIIFVDSPAL